MTKLVKWNHWEPARESVMVLYRGTEYARNLAKAWWDVTGGKPVKRVQATLGRKLEAMLAGE